MRFYSRPLILKEYPGLDNVSEYAQDNDWSTILESPTNVAGFEHRKIVWRRYIEGTLQIHYGADEHTRNSYVFASSEGRGLTQSLAAMLADNLDVWTFHELVAATVGTDGAIRPEMLIRLLMAAPDEFDESVYALLRLALTAPEEKTRELAVWATSINPWPEFRTLLAEVATQDESPSMRRRANRMLAAFDAADV